MSSDDFDDESSGKNFGDVSHENLGASPTGHEAGPTGTGQFLEARATIYHESGETSSARLEISTHRFRRAPASSLAESLKESEGDLEGIERIEVQIGGEELTLKQTGWEIQ